MISRIVVPSRSIKQSDETTLVYESNVAEFNTRVVARVWLPERMAVAFGYQSARICLIGNH